jgi:2-polyprenyl-3-methyl-5-hydroxy-6-metoxy-1,4-benzoquinol methylase
MSQIISPVTGKNNVEIIDRIDSKLIIEKYQKDYNIDVNPYFIGITKVSICRCKDSMYRFYYPVILGDGHFYEKLQSISPSYYHWNWEHGEAFNVIKKNDYVLDIGCGSGFFLEGIKEKTVNVKGLEYNDLALKKCKERGITAIKSNIEDFSKENMNCFDVICAFQVLEHISDVKSFISSCLNALRPGGKLIIGVPNNNPYLYRKDINHTLNMPPHHIGLWNKKSLQKLALFFEMQNFSLQVEPLYNFEYWFKIQIDGNIINRSRFLRKIAHKVLKRFSHRFAGRNLLAIYTKN